MGCHILTHPGGRPVPISDRGQWGNQKALPFFEHYGAVLADMPLQCCVEVWDSVFRLVDWDGWGQFGEFAHPMYICMLIQLTRNWDIKCSPSRDNHLMCHLVIRWAPQPHIYPHNKFMHLGAILGLISQPHTEPYAEFRGWDNSHIAMASQEGPVIRNSIFNTITNTSFSHSCVTLKFYQYSSKLFMILYCLLCETFIASRTTHYSSWKVTLLLSFSEVQTSRNI